jgi:hypothetical protein
MSPSPHDLLVVVARVHRADGASCFGAIPADLDIFD